MNVTYFAAHKRRDGVGAIFIRQGNTITRYFHACNAHARKTCRWNLFEKVRAEQRAEQFVQIHAQITCARKISTRKNRRIVLRRVEWEIFWKMDLKDVLK